MSDYVIRRGFLLRNSPRKERYAFAVHEAGHAVVSHAMGERPLRLWLVGKGLERGFTTTQYLKRRGRYDPIARAVIAMAGHEAECILLGRPRNKLPVSDYQTVLGLGCSVYSATLAGNIARRIIRREIKALRRVARALYERGSLNRRQFLRVYRG